jgi:hypothetical protein
LPGEYEQIDACRREAFDESGVVERLLDAEDGALEFAERETGMGYGTLSCVNTGLAPSIALNFLVEATRRRRSRLVRELKVRGLGRTVGWTIAIVLRKRSKGK